MQLGFVAAASATLDHLWLVHGQGHNELRLDAQGFHVLQQARCLV